MSHERIDVWRAALKDETHPRHKAAWVLFTGDFSLKYADKRLGDQREVVIEWLFEILDTPELYEVNSLGKGASVMNAAALLGHWKVEAALPKLLELLQTIPDDDDLYSSVADALAALGEIVVDPLLALAQTTGDENARVMIASTLVDAAPQDPRVFAHVAALFQTLENGLALDFVGEHLVVLNPAKAIPLLEQCLKKRKLEPIYRQRIQRSLNTAREEAAKLTD